MRTIQLIGVPAVEPADVDAEAVVIALKSRTLPADQAVAQSLQALAWLQKAGCRQFFFKYCSTFDSTDQGNIGPVAEALADHLGTDFVVACPAFPENRRSVFNGYLFVGDVLLNESGMKNHPLTPMTDANLVRVLGRQVKGRVGLISYETVCRGAEAIQEAITNLRRQQIRFAVVDAIRDEHLMSIGRALASEALVTGGSGIAMGLPQNFHRQGLLAKQVDAARLPHIGGKAAVISGSCSLATQEQVTVMKQRHPALRLDVPALADNFKRTVSAAVDWAAPLLDAGPVLIYTTDSAGGVQSVQERMGRERSGDLAENAQGEIARRLVDLGVRRLIVAGGETSGAVVKALNVSGLKIGPQIDPGVPWTVSLDEPLMALALKSGNFGGPDFFERAFDMLKK